MRFFKRASSAAGPEAIAAFWTWWPTAKDRIAAGIADGSVRGLVDEISREVKAIDKRLAWELSKGASSQHAFVVSPEGDPAVRALALDWRAAAPPADAVWEYHPSRQASTLGRLVIDGLDVDLSAYRAIAAWDETRERVDVRLWHPTLDGVDPHGRMRVGFLFLDNLLGEDDVERWIGEIDALDAPIEGRTPDELVAEVRRRAATATGQSWVLAERSDGALVLVNKAVKPIDHPYRSTSLVVTVDRGIEQLSQSGELADLDDAEERLVQAMDAVDTVHLGHITERRQRAIQFMCADPERARPVADAWCVEERRFGPKVSVKADPAWAFRRDYGL